VASPDEEFDIELAFDDWLEKESAGEVYDAAAETALIKQFQETKDPQVFEDLYFRHKAMIGGCCLSPRGGILCRRQPLMRML